MARRLRIATIAIGLLLLTFIVYWLATPDTRRQRYLESLMLAGHISELQRELGTDCAQWLGDEIRDCESGPEIRKDAESVRKAAISALKKSGSKADVDQLIALAEDDVLSYECRADSICALAEFSLSRARSLGEKAAVTGQFGQMVDALRVAVKQARSPRASQAVDEALHAASRGSISKAEYAEKKGNWEAAIERWQEVLEFVPEDKDMKSRLAFAREMNACSVFVEDYSTQPGVTWVDISGTVYNDSKYTFKEIRREEIVRFVGHDMSELHVEIPLADILRPGEKRPFAVRVNAPDPSQRYELNRPGVMKYLPVR